jgi:hypothetical protein
MNLFTDTKAQWKARKAKYGIPDGVCKFSMGDKLDAFAKLAAPIQIGDYEAQIAAYDTLIPTLTAYNTALGALKPTKFTCKTAEQAGNHKKVKDEVAGWLANAKDLRARAVAFQKPMVMLSQNYKASFAKFKTLPKDDSAAAKAALQQFYSKEIRNDLGQYVKLAVKLPLGSAVLQDLKSYEQWADAVDANLNGKQKPTDFKKAHLDMAKCFAVLSQHMN